jgi:predicted DNA-binding transcriptional regulator AlpA
MVTKNQPSIIRPTVPHYARAKGAAAHFQIARSTLWLWAKTLEGFPQPIKAGCRVTLFDLNAIDAFIQSRNINSRNGGEL